MGLYRILWTAALGAAFAAAAPYSGPPPVSWEQAPRYVGKTVTISGAVVVSHRDGLRCELNFDKDWQAHFTVVIPRSRLRYFPPKPEEYYLNKRVLVRGRVRQDGERPVIRVLRRDQIWVVGEALPGVPGGPPLRPEPKPRPKPKPPEPDPRPREPEQPVLPVRPVEIERTPTDGL